MATQPLSLPTECYSRGAASDRQLLFMGTSRVIVAVRDQQSEQEEDATLVELPKGAKSLICVGRFCGDFHVDLEGNGFHVAAIGATPKEAVQAAVAQVQA